MPRRGVFSCLFVLIFVLVATLSPAMAETGSVQVTVYEVLRDGTQDLLIGARVILSHVDKTYADNAQITNMNGQVVFADVPEGVGYVVTVNMPGYAGIQDTLKVVGGQVVQSVFALTEELVEQVRVIGKGSVVELEGAQTSTTISDDLLADLPVLGREYQNVLAMAPGVEDSDGDGNPNVHGSRERDFQMQVDGVSNVDPLTGEFQSNINPDSIEEIEIVDSGADASYGGVVGGYGKIVTKQGSNEFEGSFNFFFQDSMFDNDRGGGVDPLDYGLIQPSFFVSGPIIKDRVWFFASHEYVDKADPVNLVAGGGFVQSLEAFRHSDKITWQVDPKNKLQFQFSGDPLEVSPAAVSSLAPPATGVFFEQGGPTYSAKWIAPFTPNFFWESTVAFSDIEYKWRPFDPTNKNECVAAGGNSDPYPGDDIEFLMCNNNSKGGLRSGTYFQTHEDARQRWTYRADAEQFLSDVLGGDHRIKVGGKLEQVTYTNNEFTEDRLTKRETRLRIPQLDQGGSVGSPLVDPPTVIITHVDPQINQTRARGNYYVAYFNDSFTPISQLNINVGLRLSREEVSSNGYQSFDVVAERAEWGRFFDACMLEGNTTAADCWGREYGMSAFTVHEADVPTIAGCDGFINREQCVWLYDNGVSRERDINARAPEFFDIVNTDIEPRFSVSWDPWDDGKTRVAASWGRYYGDTILAPVTAEVDGSPTNAFWSLDQFNQLNNRRFKSAYSTSVVDRNLRRQHMDEWTFLVEREIAAETSVRARYISRDYKDQLQDIDVNHAPVFWDDLANPDSPFPHLYEPIGNDPNNGPQCVQIGVYADCSGEPFSGSRIGTIPDGQPDLQLVSPFFNNIYKIGNYNETKYRAVIFELTRRYYQNWELAASYTFAKARGQAEDFNQGVGDDQTNVADEEGWLSNDVRHSVKVTGRVYIPVWGGFRVGGGVFWRTGEPYSIIERANIVDFPSYLGQGEEVITWDRTFRVQLITPRTRFPTDRRNDQRNGALWSINTNIQKEFQIKGTRVTAEFNIFNLLGDTSLIIFGVVRQEIGLIGGETIFQEFPQAVRRQGRQFQLALKANF